MTQHTATPWKTNALPAEGDLRDSRAFAIWSADNKTAIATSEFGEAFNKQMPADEEKHANLEFIVRAANCHDEMLAALKAAHDHMLMDPSGRGSGSRAMSLVLGALKSVERQERS